MLLIVILLLILLATLDGSFSSLIISLGMYILGTIIVSIYCKNNRNTSLRLYNIIFFIYFALAFVVSLSFSSSNFFLVSDSSRYIESYMNSTSFFFRMEDFIKCYIGFSDSNLFYNSYINIMSILANKYLDGMTVFSLTLCQTIWGVLSSIVLFRILIRRFNEKKSFRIALLFAICSLFLFYSTVIIRDIIICFLYLLAFDIIDQKFKINGLIKLLLIIIITWGIRLYSGIFLITFLAYYFYVKMHNGQYKKIITFLFVIFLIGVSTSIFSLDIVQQTIDELNMYSELSNEQSRGGIISKLQMLPIGISQFAIILYTMFKPLPPFSIYMGVETFSHFVMSTMFLIAGFFWFVVFYSLCYLLFFKKYIFKIPFERIILLLVCLVFMLANASHPDIRRMLPVFPILYVQYAEICKTENITLFSSKISKNLMIFYIVIAFGMLVIM